MEPGSTVTLLPTTDIPASAGLFDKNSYTSSYSHIVCFALPFLSLPHA